MKQLWNGIWKIAPQDPRCGPEITILGPSVRAERISPILIARVPVTPLCDPHRKRRGDSYDTNL